MYNCTRIYVHLIYDDTSNLPEKQRSIAKPDTVGRAQRLPTHFSIEILHIANFGQRVRFCRGHCHQCLGVCTYSIMSRSHVTNPCHWCLLTACAHSNMSKIPSLNVLNVCAHCITNLCHKTTSVTHNSLFVKNPLFRRRKLKDKMYDPILGERYQCSPQSTNSSKSTMTDG